MLQAIEEAKEYIHLETYIWEPDEVGLRFSEALCRKAREGVRVRVIFDSFGSSSLTWGFIEDLKDARVQVLEFRPIVGMLGSWDGMERLSRRDHRKILVVDGQTSFCGGINLGMNYAPKSEGGKGWRDTHLQIEGPVTYQLEDLFRDTWNQHSDHPYPPVPRQGLERLAGEPSLAAALPSDEAGHRTTIRKHYLHAIRHAQEFVYIANAYFVPNRSFVAALCRASKRGVNVRLLLPSFEHNDVLPVQLASQHIYAQLMKAGVKIHVWPYAHMHAKAAVVDGVWSTVGSYNLDAVSLFQNLEVIVEVLSESFGSEMVRMFERDFDRSVLLDLDHWEKRNPVQKLVEPLFYRIRRIL